MIWHLFLKPLLMLVGNIIGWRPDADDEQRAALGRVITPGRMFWGGLIIGLPLIVLLALAQP